MSNGYMVGYMSNELERVNTGINGLDELIYGGIPKRNQVLISGDAGTGKTLLCFEALYRNAKIDIPSTFITLEESKSSLLENAGGAFSTFDDVDELVSKNTIGVYSYDITEVLKSTENWQKFVTQIARNSKSNNSQIVVVDSISSLRPYADSDRIFTRSVALLVQNLRNLGVTSFITVETPSLVSEETTGLFGTFMFDGTIWLNKVNVSGSSQYVISVVKMRRSDHVKSTMPFEITTKGFNIFK